MQLINVTISDSTDDAIVYINLNSADTVSTDNDKQASITRDDLSAGEQATFDAFLTMIKTKIPV